MIRCGIDLLSHLIIAREVSRTRFVESGLRGKPLVLRGMGKFSRRVTEKGLIDFAGWRKGTNEGGDGTCRPTATSCSGRERHLRKRGWTERVRADQMGHTIDVNQDQRLERETGIEPATNSLEGCDSTTELLPPLKSKA